MSFCDKTEKLKKSKNYWTLVCIKRSCQTCLRVQTACTQVNDGGKLIQFLISEGSNCLNSSVNDGGKLIQFLISEGTFCLHSSERWGKTDSVPHCGTNLEGSVSSGRFRTSSNTSGILRQRSAARPEPGTRHTQSSSRAMAGSVTEGAGALHTRPYDTRGLSHRTMGATGVVCRLCQLGSRYYTGISQSMHNCTNI